MSAETDKTVAAVESIVRQLSGIDACGPEWAEADQVRFLRVFVEEGLSEFARADEAHLDFLAECVTQAAENMQDARIHFLEERMDEADAGEPFSLPEFLINLGMVLAVELMIVGAATYGAPAVLALAAARRQSKVVRQAVARAESQTRTLTTPQPSEAGLISLMWRVKDARALERGSRPLPESHWATYFDHRQAVRALSRAESDYALGLAAHARDTELARRAAEAMDQALADTSRALGSPALIEFKDNVLGDVAVGRVAEETAVAVSQAVLDEAGEAPRTGVFATDTVVSRFLADIRQQRNVAAREWSVTRLHIRCLPDADFISSTLAGDLFHRIHEESPVATLLEPALADRTYLVRGFEGALWLSWLRSLGALGMEDVERLIIIPSLIDRPSVGEAHGNVLITELKQGVNQDDLGKLVGKGVLYPGLARITELQADYLYKSFAREFFVRNPDQVPFLRNPGQAPALPFAISRYDELAALPVRWGPLDRDRRNRLAEMKLLVITFFRLFGTDPAALGGDGDPVGDLARQELKTLLDAGPQDDYAAQFLKSLPPVCEPAEADRAAARAVPPTPGTDETAPAEGTNPAELLGKLQQLVTDLDLFITHFPQESTDESPSGRAARAEADLLRVQIETQQQLVRDLVTELKAHGSGPEAAPTPGYAAHIDELLAWPEPAWSFCGPILPEEKRRHARQP